MARRYVEDKSIWLCLLLCRLVGVTHTLSHRDTLGLRPSRSVQRDAHYHVNCLQQEASLLGASAFVLRDRHLATHTGLLGVADARAAEAASGVLPTSDTLTDHLGTTVVANCGLANVAEDLTEEEEAALEGDDCLPMDAGFLGSTPRVTSPFGTELPADALELHGRRCQLHVPSTFSPPEGSKLELSFCFQLMEVDRDTSLDVHGDDLATPTDGSLAAGDQQCLPMALSSSLTASLSGLMPWDLGTSFSCAPTLGLGSPSLDLSLASAPGQHSTLHDALRTPRVRSPVQAVAADVDDMEKPMPLDWL